MLGSIPHAGSSCNVKYLFVTEVELEMSQLIELIFSTLLIVR